MIRALVHVIVQTAQTAQTTIPIDFLWHIIEGLFTAVVGWATFEARSMKKQMVAFNQSFAEWRVELLGIDGKGGMNEEMKALGRRAYLWDKQLGDHETRIVVIERVTRTGDHLHRRLTDTEDDT